MNRALIEIGYVLVLAAFAVFMITLAYLSGGGRTAAEPSTPAYCTRENIDAGMAALNVLTDERNTHLYLVQVGRGDPSMFVPRVAEYDATLRFVADAMRPCVTKGN